MCGHFEFWIPPPLFAADCLVPVQIAAGGSLILSRSLAGSPPPGIYTTAASGGLARLGHTPRCFLLIFLSASEPLPIRAIFLLTETSQIPCLIWAQDPCRLVPLAHSTFATFW